MKAIAIVIFAYFCYWLLFPGLFVYNFNIDLFVFNSMLRLVSLMEVVEIPFGESILAFLSEYQTGNHIGQRNVMKTMMALPTVITRVGLIVNYLIYIIPALFLIFPFWLNRLHMCTGSTNVDMEKLPIIMFVASVASMGGGPFLFSTFFWFFLSFSLYPLLIVLLRKRRTGYFGHHISNRSFSRRRVSNHL